MTSLTISDTCFILIYGLFRITCVTHLNPIPRCLSGVTSLYELSDKVRLYICTESSLHLWVVGFFFQCCHSSVLHLVDSVLFYFPFCLHCVCWFCWFCWFWRFWKRSDFNVSQFNLNSIFIFGFSPVLWVLTFVFLNSKKKCWVFLPQIL